MDFKYKLINADRLEPVYAYDNNDMVEIDLAYNHIPHIGKSIACLLSVAGKPDFGFVLDNNKPISYDLKDVEETFYLCVEGIAKANIPGRHSDWASLDRLNSVFKPDLPSYFYQLSDQTIMFLEPVIINRAPSIFDEREGDQIYSFYDIKVITTKESIAPAGTRNSYSPNHIYSSYSLFNNKVTVPTSVIVKENGVLTEDVIRYINSRYNLHCLSSIQKEERLI